MLCNIKIGEGRICPKIKLRGNQGEYGYLSVSLQKNNEDKTTLRMRQNQGQVYLNFTPLFDKTTRKGGWKEKDGKTNC